MGGERRWKTEGPFNIEGMGLEVNKKGSLAQGILRAAFAFSPSTSPPSLLKSPEPYSTSPLGH
jgi:hypothetical protein